MPAVSGRTEAEARALVRSGWDRASWQYRPEASSADVFGHSTAEHLEWLRPIVEETPAGDPVLDLGCGNGIPDAEALASKFRVTGVDISQVQVDRARRRIPQAAFERADMVDLHYPPSTFAAVVCLYSLIHVPRSEQRGLLTRIRAWIRPGGLFLVITGHSAYTGVEENWLGSGAPMYWSHHDGATYAAWFDELGFAPRSRRTVREPGAAHELFLLQVPRGPATAVPR